jgi:hypothetical protein
VRTNVRSVSWESEKSGGGGQSSCPPPPRCGGLRTYFLAAQGLAGLHGFAAFFPAGAHGFAAFFLPAQGLAALGAQGFVCWANRRQRRGCKHAADRGDRSKRLERFLEGSHDSVSLSSLNIDVTSQPRRHGNQPVRHGTCEGGFDDFVEAGEDEGADANERGAHERLGNP